MASDDGQGGIRNPLRDFREGFVAGATLRADPGDMPHDWKRGWNAGRAACGEAIRHETRRLEQGMVFCPQCGRRFDPRSVLTIAESGAWYCNAKCALLSKMNAGASGG